VTTTGSRSARGFNGELNKRANPMSPVNIGYLDIGEKERSSWTFYNIS